MAAQQSGVKPRHPGDRCACGVCSGQRAATLWLQSILGLLWKTNGGALIVRGEDGCVRIFEASR